jgi:Fusaric acid resistance protein family
MATATLRLATVGFGLPRTLSCVLARALRPLLGWNNGGSRLSATSRRFAAQRLVPHDQHCSWRPGDRGTGGLLPAEPRRLLAALALWGAGCAFVATILRNSLAVAAQLAGITAAIIANSELGATGGANGDAFVLAIIRCTEICVGIVSAGVVLAGTDFGSAQRRLAALFAALAAEITGRFTGTLALAGPEFPETQPMRQELVRHVIALDPVIDEAIGESAQLRNNSPVLRRR